MDKCRACGTKLKEPNKYLPNTHISINHPDKINEDKPDFVVSIPEAVVI